MRYFRAVPSPDDFSPEEHEWLASASGHEFLFVRKSTDRWTGPPHGFRRGGFVEVPVSEVPALVSAAGVSGRCSGRC